MNATLCDRGDGWLCRLDAGLGCHDSFGLTTYRSASNFRLTTSVLLALQLVLVFFCLFCLLSVGSLGVAPGLRAISYLVPRWLCWCGDALRFFPFLSPMDLCVESPTCGLDAVFGRSVLPFQPQRPSYPPISVLQAETSHVFLPSEVITHRTENEPRDSHEFNPDQRRSFYRPTAHTASALLSVVAGIARVSPAFSRITSCMEAAVTCVTYK